jgi:transposase-like protein
MAKDTKNEQRVEAAPMTAGGLELAIRQRARRMIDAIVKEELEQALGAAPSVRSGETRTGYRHGTRERTLTTSLGPTTFAMPRARLVTAAGTTEEWRSQLVPRYQRRSAQVDEAMLGVYLSGTNTRRIKGALVPLLRGGPLSKDAVSRLVGRLADDFATWRQRDLAADGIQYLMLDGWYPKVRIGKRRVRVPVLVTLGVRADGDRVILDVRLVGDESTAAWRDVIQSLVARQIGVPTLAVIDGNPGLAAALREQWPTLAIQRCTTHKLRNLEAKAPARLREELAEDYRRMIYADSRRHATDSSRSGGFAAPRSSSASMKPARTSSPFCASRPRNGRPCARRMRSSGSTRNSDGAPRRKRVCLDKTRSSSCSSACYAPAK